jgi:alpha-ketoglutarate-dependent taurine dioxygenase
MTKFPKIGLDNASQYLNDVLLPSYHRFKRMQTRQMPRRSGSPWMWTLAFGHHEDRTPTHGYATTREAAMAAFAKSWRRE